MIFMSIKPLYQAVEICGGISLLANRMNEKSNTISMWLQRGNIPAEKVIAVAKATEYQITPNKLRSDLYPYEFDGLPENKRMVA